MHCLALISAVDPLLVDLTALALHGQDALVLTASLYAGGEDDFIRLTAAQVPINGEDGIDGGAPGPAHASRRAHLGVLDLLLAGGGGRHPDRRGAAELRPHLPHL